MLDAAVFIPYLAACAVLGLFGLHRVWLLADWALARRRAKATPAPACDAPVAPPVITVQLPLYNERAVAERLIDAVCAFEWPRDRLEVQVLDDSDDDTAAVVERCVAAHRARGVDVVQLRREGRAGYKAGALAHGLSLARGELIAIFDADFVPPPDFLARVAPSFARDDVDMAQARWGHLNERSGWLTRAQAIFLDAHFTIEHRVRSLRGRFFNFNGTAGVWRRSAIERAGGWDAATLTEDLDLSFRAQLAGSRFTYLDDVEVPAELPADVNAFKGQQHRWAKGSVETARRLLGRVWRAPLPFCVKLDATLKLGQNFAFLWLALVVVTMPFVALTRSARHELDVVTLGLATLPAAVYFLVAQLVRGRSLARSLAALPLALGVGAALSINNARAVLEGLFGGGERAFVRTPKRGSAGRALYPSRVHPTALLEVLLGGLHLSSAVVHVRAGHATSTAFLWLFGASLMALGLGSLKDALASLARRRGPSLPRARAA